MINVFRLIKNKIIFTIMIVKEGLSPDYIDIIEYIYEHKDRSLL